MIQISMYLYRDIKVLNGNYSGRFQNSSSLSSTKRCLEIDISKSTLNSHLQKAQIHAVLKQLLACLNAHEDLIVIKKREKNEKGINPINLSH